MVEMDSEGAKKALKEASRVLVLTGAGVSAESGVPTFRGKNGLWKNYSAEELATPQAFRRNPALVWEWYYWRRSIIAGAKPNIAHILIAELERIKGDGFLLVTQNVDGLHREAGSRRVVEFHGNIWVNRCTECERERYDRTCEMRGLPRCPACGSLERPGVVWFGESIPEDAINASFQFARNCEVCLVVGTSAVVQPAASIALVAKENGSVIIEVNLDPTPLTSLAHYSFRGKAGDVLPILIETEK